MASAYKKGDVVKVKAVIPSGPVEAVRMDDEGTVYYQISWQDAEGKTQVRWFSEDVLTAG